MTRRTYLEITYRRGRPLAAYLYLPRRDGAAAARTVEGAGGLLVNYAADGRPIGIEIPHPAAATASSINALLASLSQPPMAAADLKPLSAAAA